MSDTYRAVEVTALERFASSKRPVPEPGVRPDDYSKDSSYVTGIELFVDGAWPRSKRIDHPPLNTYPPKPLPAEA